jgi:truncated hemoglobin YjbI
MKKLSLTALALTNLLCLIPACGDTGDDDTTGSTTASTPATPATEPEPTDTGTMPTDTTAETGDPTGEPADGPICAHLGGIEGVGELVTAFFGVVLADDKINAYFLTTDTDFATLGTCVVNQLGEATGCDGVTYGCATMKASHEGLGISQQDFGDFAADFITAWDAHKASHPDVTQEDFDTVIGVLGGMAPDIVEDAADNATVYQRVGRKPAIKGLIGEPGAAGSFVDNVANDAAINGFFGATDFVRLNTCLTRQVHSLDGPNTYGKEIDPPVPSADPGVSAAAPCADMVSSHANLVDANDSLGIEVADFGALVTDLVTAMTDAGVTADDQNIIAGALGPLCSSIVTVDPENCP